VIKRIADLVFAVTGKNPLLDIALELERIALQDDYFVTRKLYPNVDFYSGLIYQAMGFPTEMFPVLFAIPRTAGWVAQWEEMLLGKVHMVNLIVTIPGAKKDRLAITGHYDTKLFREFRFVGASDGGSSAAFLVEFARVLKGRRNAMTIELIFLDGEEAVVDW